LTFFTAEDAESAENAENETTKKKPAVSRRARSISALSAVK
jgi:hypothetical protein